MTLRDTNKKFGSLSKTLHWVVAFSMIGMFCLGYWMRGLDYYNAWYLKAPHIHESIGLLLCIVIIFFLFWRLNNENPDDSDLKPLERLGGKIMKISLYIMMFSIFITGYLISSAGDNSIDVFNWFTVPASLDINQNKVLVGQLHQYFAYFIMTLTLVHLGAALKHHFVDNNDILKRIIPFVKIP